MTSQGINHNKNGKIDKSLTGDSNAPRPADLSEINQKELYIRELETMLSKQSEEYSHSERLQKTLFTISELSFGAEDIEHFYHSLHQTMGQLLNAENFYIALVDKTQSRLEFVYFVDSIDANSTEDGQNYTIPLSSKSLSTYVYGLKQATLLNEKEILGLEENGLIERLGPLSYSWLGAPLIADGLVLGIIVVQSYSEKIIYKQWHKELFDYVSNVIATTLERKQHRLQLELKVKERTVKLEKEIDLRKQREKIETALLTIANLANSKISLDEFYKKLHQTISELIYAENFYIALSLDDSQTISFVYFVDSVDTTTIKELTNLSLEEIDKTLTAFLFSANTSLLFTGDEIDAMAKKGIIESHGPSPCSWLGIQLNMDEEVLGVIALQSYHQDKIYDRRDRLILEYISKHVATAIHRKTSNQRLESLVKKRTREIDEINKELIKQIVNKTQSERVQSNLYKISRLASGVENMPEFYQELHRILSELLYVKNFYIALWDDEEQKLVLKYHTDEKIERDLVKENHLINESSLSTFLFRNDKPIMLDHSEIELLEVQEKINLKGPKFVSLICVPLHADERSIGIMVLQSYLENTIYEQWHLELLEYVSSQVALTLSRKKDRAELERQVHERTLKLELEIENRRKSQETQSALYYIANLSNTELELDEFYKELHKIIGRLVYSENFFIGLKNNHDESMNIVYYVDTVDDYDVESISAIPVEKLRKSITYYVMNSGRPLLATNQDIKALIKKEELDAFGVETVSWLGIPLIINGSVIGIMVLQSYLPHRYLSEQDRELMIFVGQHVASALQRNENKDYLKIQVSERTNALNQSNNELKKQIAETKKGEKLQAALYQIADLASSNEDMDYLYGKFHEIISDLIYANNFFIALYDDNREKLEFVYFVDTLDDLSKDSVRKISAADISQTFTGHVLKTGRSFLKTKGNEKKYKQMGFKKIGKEAYYWLGVPLKIDHNIIGLIAVQSYDENIELDLWHQELLEFVSHHIAITLERKHSHKALERRVEERTLELAKINQSLKKQVKERKRSESIQAALYKIANLSNTNIPLRLLFENIHKIVKELLYAENFYISLWNEEKDDMDWVYFVDLENKFDQEMMDKIPDKDKKRSFARHIVDTAKPILVDKTMMLSMVEDGIVSMIGPATEYFLGVPLLSSNTAIGAMVVQSYNIEIKYNIADQELLNFVAQSIVSTIEKRELNIKLEKRVESRTEELSISNKKLQKEIKHRRESEELQKALFEISETPQKCVSESELYTRLHEIIARLMHVESLYIALVDHDNRTFNFDYIFDNVDNHVKATIPIGNSLTSYVYRKGKTIHVNKQQVRELEKSGEIDHLGTYSVDWIGVPLISAGAIYGIMILQSYDEKYIYTSREVDILNFVSTHIAEALQRKNTEKRLRKTYAELATKTKKSEAASKAKSSFLATVSHEIRTPMNGILGLLSLLSDTSMSRKQRDYVSKISISANSLLGIINDILDYSKIEQGKLELEHIEFDLLVLLDNLVDLFSSRINEKKLDFTIDIDSNVELLRVGDSLRLSQILINLVGNAIKFTEEGYIRILVTEKTESQLQFFVEDSGIGIAADQHSKIFASFTQADDTTTRKFGGSGLGLSICQQLVSMMKGNINVKGELGVGSRFFFDVNIPRKEKEQDHNLDLTGSSILLISDHKPQIRSWQHFCERFSLPFMSLNHDEIINYKQQPKKIPELLSHIFIDEGNETNLGIDSIGSIQELLKFKTPCFLLAYPSPHMSELPNLGDDVQFIPKPNKMGVILSLLQQDYDALKIINSDSKNKNKNKIRNIMLNRDILVAEDNLINQQVAKEILQKSGANVTLVVNGQLAVEACQKHHFDLVLMDMQMPVMDGYQASKAIRKFISKEQLPIIAMTANVMKGDREKCLSYGMNDYVGKPIDRAKFFITIEKYLEPRESIKQDTNITTNTKNIIAPNNNFDIHVLADRFDSMELAEELIEMFYVSHQSDVEFVSDLIKKDELSEARSIVHKLKGSAGELGLMDLHQQSELIETELKNNVTPNHKELDLFSQLLKSYLTQFNSLIQSVK